MAPHESLCTQATTPIGDIQGDGYSSPLVGESLTAGGVVTRVLESGDFFIEDPAPGQAGRSRALFVLPDDASAPVKSGQRLHVSGTVTETGNARDTVTSLSAVTTLAVCAEGVDLPLTTLSLPWTSLERETHEGMRLQFTQALTVTDNYARSRGRIGLSQAGRLWSPTERVQPGEEARGLGRENRQRRLDVQLLPGDLGNPLPAGQPWHGATGVLGHDGRYPLFLLESASPSATLQASTFSPARAGHLRIVSANLRNFFNGDGRGGGFPTERGAESVQEFEQQKQRMAAAFAVLQPALLGVQELENDGFGPHSAAEEFKLLLARATGRDYNVVTLPGHRVGNDEIAVGLFYDPSLLEPAGPPATLFAPAFDQLSRQPLAQAFRERASGTVFLAAVNHLKSKGSCPDEGENRRQNDGQGCWNPARTAAVRTQVEWLEELAAQAQTARILVMGDMNAQRREDPVRAFTDAGYTDLVEKLTGTPSYTYVYRGEAGTLDYVFASPALEAAARQARAWHINADWPQNLELPRPWLRMSDHDPVVVDFELSQAATSD